MKLNSQPIGVTDTGFELARAQHVVGEALCDYCSIEPNCKLKSARPRTCNMFVPGLGFAPPLKGLDGIFSTFRASSVWYERARVVHDTHKTFGLWNTKTGEFISYARLKNAYRGPFHDLMARHARLNHLCKDKMLTDAEAAEWLPKQIRNLAGSRYVKRPDQICTVIYLETQT